MSEILVVKLGGTTIAEQAHVLADVAAVARRRPVVLVHGGGKRITEWLERLGVPSKFEGGLRVTDAQSLEVAAAVLRGVVNSELVAGLRDLGVDAVGLSGVDGGLLIAERIPELGLVASVTGLRRDLLDAILVSGQVPVVAPLARDADGIVCNVNADDAAAGIAAGLGARQLVLLTDVDGVRDADGRRLDTLTVAEAEHLIETGVIAGGMVPKVRAALSALGWEGAEAIIADSGAESALERALSDPIVRNADHGVARSGRSRVTGVSGMTPGQELKRLRQRAIRQLVTSQRVRSQRELVDALTDQGFAVTQATVSRDITELGLLKVPRTDGHVYVAPEDVAVPSGNGLAGTSDDRLRRILADVPVTVGRSGLILVLTGTPGTASVVAQAIDESTLQEQEGTLAGDNTLLVLFADEARLERWQARFEAIARSLPEVPVS